MKLFEGFSEHGIFHGIIIYIKIKSLIIKGKTWLIYNRVGVSLIFNILISNDFINPIDNIIYIINGIFHGIFHGIFSVWQG